MSETTTYEVCATILDRSNEVHTGFHTVSGPRSEIISILASRAAKDALIRNVSVISVIELDEEA